MKEWLVTDTGWRTWARFTGGARWSYGTDGELVAYTALAAPINVAGASYASLMARLTDTHGAGIAEVTDDPFYRRALLALMGVECPTGALPCLGDCRNAAGAVVPCGSAGADAPRSAGLYQITRTTAAGLGVSFDELAREAGANHRAALALATRLEPSHGKDFVTLAVLWNTGSIRAEAMNPWGVHTWDRDTLTRYVARWNAVPTANAPTASSSSSGLGGLILNVLIVAALKKALNL